jgi:hypothetical protein
MMSVFLVLIFGMSALSLISYVYCWNDIKSGRPYILSLRQITTVMDREKLNQMFGPPERGYFYKLEPQVLYSLLKEKQGFYYRECAADVLCVFGAWRYMTHDVGVATMALFILLASVCQGVNLVYGYFLVKKWGSQIREEIEKSED